MPLGLVLALMRLSPSRLLAWPAGAVIEVFRTTPPLVQLFWFFFALPILIRVEMTPYVAAVLTFSIQSAAFFAAFDGPARAVRCACAVSSSVKSLGIEVRAGAHTGECEVIGDKFGGIAVHIGARVAGCAAPGEVLVSGTVKDLVAGSGLSFEDRGRRPLKGLPGDWQLYSVVH